MADVNMFTTPFQLTKSMHRDLYPAIDPTNPALSAKGKIAIITGAGGGLGAVSTSNVSPGIKCNLSSLYFERLSQGHGLRPVLPVSSLLDVRPIRSISRSIMFRKSMHRSQLSWSLLMSRTSRESRRCLPG